MSFLKAFWYQLFLETDHSAEFKNLILPTSDNPANIIKVPVSTNSTPLVVGVKAMAFPRSPNMAPRMA